MAVQAGFKAGLKIVDELALDIQIKRKEDIADDKTVVDVSDPNNPVSVYNDYQKQKNKGALVSAKYIFNENWEMVARALEYCDHIKYLMTYSPYLSKKLWLNPHFNQINNNILITHGGFDLPHKSINVI